jgi:HSP20 family protein
MNLVRYTYPAIRNQAPVFTSPWGGLENDIDRLFSVALGDLSAGHRFPIDVYEDKENTYVRAELPGVDRNAINVEHADGRLSITATRKLSRGNDDAAKSESFNRILSIPDTLVQADKISAVYENGVLTVTLPKREEAKPRKVTVTVN